MSYLPKNVFEEQKKRLLIITDGEKDIGYYYRGKKYSKFVKRFTKPIDIIGVGDTFLDTS